MNSKINYLMVVATLFLFMACSTQEYRHAEQSCTNVSYQKYPQELKQVMKKEGRMVTVPTGEFNCTSDTSSTFNTYGGNTLYGNKNTNTNCKPVTKQEWVTEEVLRTVDVNQDQRNDWVTQCTASVCLSKYGNRDCEQNSNTASSFSESETNKESDKTNKRKPASYNDKINVMPGRAEI